VQSSLGVVEETGLYILKLYGVANLGGRGLSQVATALLLLYPPGDAETLSDNTSLRIRHNPGPWRGQLLQSAPGWAMVSVTVPWWALSTNPA
jgi:hypothetical protein